MAQFTADEEAVASVLAQQVAEPPKRPSPEAEVGTEDATEEEPKKDYREFDPRHKDGLKGLLYLGYLDDDMVIHGHNFHIATPTQRERLQVGPLIKEFSGTMTEDLAYMTAMVAIYLVSIDGEELPKPVLNNAKDTAVRDRFNWVIDNLQRALIPKIADRCYILEEEVEGTLDAMGKASA